MRLMNLVAGLVPLACLMIGSYMRAKIALRYGPNITKFGKPTKPKPKTSKFLKLTNKAEEST